LSSPLVLSSLFVDHPFIRRRASRAIGASCACNLRRSRSVAQLNVGKRRTSKGVTEQYEGLWRLPRPLSQWSDSAVPDRANIVRLSIGNRRKIRVFRKSRRDMDRKVLQAERSFFSAQGTPQRSYRRLFAAPYRGIGASADALADDQAIDASQLNCIVDCLKISHSGFQR
jgi:hypothetical protein